MGWRCRASPLPPAPSQSRGSSIGLTSPRSFARGFDLHTTWGAVRDAQVSSPAPGGKRLDPGRGASADPSPETASAERPRLGGGRAAAPTGRSGDTRQRVRRGPAGWKGRFWKHEKPKRHRMYTVTWNWRGGKMLA
ncbi:interferon epsilon isoform X2 [Erinaceus europaeus]|uniref:Interferon epsilon isoform X2 n=1 Tax=Erinaceus europaeus TaxID=9365 RepID=A0ABM3Y3H4_ERIEU|nr:interferon epsilon isoform X2 [Erinaceus europaeus]